MKTSRKKQIINAAGKCFSKYGYEKTSLDDIAKIVGINKASFYHYFKNKEEIFTAMITEEADKYMANIIDKANGEEDCKERILSWISAGFTYLNSNSILNQLSYESIISLNPYIENLVDYSKKKGTAYLADTLSFYMNQGKIKEINTLKTARLIQNIIYSLKDYLHRHNDDPLPEDKQQKKIIEEVLETVGIILDGIVISQDGP